MKRVQNKRFVLYYFVVWFSIFFVLYSCYPQGSSYHSVPESQETPSLKGFASQVRVKDLFVIDSKMIQQEVNGLMNQVAKVLKGLDSADYFLSSNLIIDIPGINQEVIIDLGFKGSGDVLLPIKRTTLEIRQKDNKIEPSGNVVLDIGKCLLQHEIKQHCRLTDLFSGKSLSPFDLFALKLLLLVKNTYGVNDSRFLFQEIFRLMLRLSLSSEEIVVQNGNRGLINYMSPWIINIFEKRAPYLTSLINTMWNIVSDTAHVDKKAQSNTKVRGFVFGSHLYADLCLRIVEKEGGDFVEEVIEKHMKLLSGEKVESYEQLKEVQGSFAAKHLFAHVADQRCLDELFPDLITKLVPEKPVQKCTDQAGLTWLFYKTVEPSSMDNVLGQLCTETLALLKNYALCKRKLLDEDNKGAAYYRAQWHKHQGEKAQREYFIHTQEGRESLLRMQNAFAHIEHLKDDSENRLDDFKNQFSEQRDRLFELEENRKKIERIAAGNGSASLKALAQERLLKINTELKEIDNFLSITEPLIKILEQEIEEKIALSPQSMLYSLIMNTFNDFLAVGQITPQLFEDLDNVSRIIEEKTMLSAHVLRDFSFRNQQKIAIYAHELDLLAQKKQVSDEHVLVSEKTGDCSYESCLDAYIYFLQKQHDECVAHEKKVKVMMNYQAGDLEIDPSILEELKQQVFSLIINEKSFFSYVASLSDESAQFVADMKSNCEPFYSLRSNYFDRIKMLLDRYKKVKEYWPLCRYILTMCAPEFSSLLDSLEMVEKNLEVNQKSDDENNKSTVIA